MGRLLAIITWLLVAGSLMVITGSLTGRPLLIAAVPTGSMLPVLQPGDLIGVMPAWTLPDPHPGDIVVFKTPADRTWIVHRVIGGSNTEGFVTKGDANPVPDKQRVFTRDVAGWVPQWGGRAIRFPRLGSVRLLGGTLSSPVVSGAALGIGIYLLMADLWPQLRLQPRRRRQQARPSPVHVLGMYLALSGVVFLVTLIPAWSLSSRQEVAYEIVAQRPDTVSKAGQYLAHKPHQEELPVQNPSPLPMFVAFKTDDPHIRYEPRSALVPGHAKVSFSVTVANPKPGRYAAMAQTGVFLPFLPVPMLDWLSQISLGLTAFSISLVPALGILALAFVDRRCLLGIRQLVTRFALRTLP